MALPGAKRRRKMMKRGFEMQPITRIIQKHLDLMTIGEYFRIDLTDLGEDVKRTMRNIRSQVSRANRYGDLNWKVHKDAQGVWIWFDPSPRAKKRQLSPTFDRLITLQSAHKQAQLERDIETANRLVREIGECVEQLQGEKESKQTPKNKRALHMPLVAVLEYLGVNQFMWDLLDPKEQLRRRILAEIEMKKERDTQLDNQSTQGNSTATIEGNS